MEAPREYDLVLYGATGYTGKYTAEWLQQNAPTDLKWAIAGRNAQKLEAVASALKELNPDRAQPTIEAIDHALPDLKALASKATVLISTVGPFWKYGTPVVEACVASGTHYLDVTGEIPWVRQMIERFHDAARAKKCIVMPQSGVDSVPSDMLAYVLAQYLREKHNQGTATCLNVITSMKGSISGGTADTMLSIGAAYPARYLMSTAAPFALSPTPPTSPLQAASAAAPRTWAGRLLGYALPPPPAAAAIAASAGAAGGGAGALGGWPGGTIDRAIVHRSWGLLAATPRAYGREFRFELLLRAPSRFAAMVQSFVFALLQVALVVPPARWLLRRSMHKPGAGPPKEEAKGHWMKYLAVATGEEGKVAAGKMNLLGGGAYEYTGLFVAVAALTILRGKAGVAREGGVLTAACLEGEFVEGLEKAGVKIDVEDL